MKRKSTNGLYNTRLYRIYAGMIQRCYVSTNINFHSYGGRGIKICDEWKDNFKAFYDWSMANGYRDDLTIDRIDNDGNYEPSNCRWETIKKQSNNKRNNRLMTLNGETHTVSEWAEITGIDKRKLFARLRYGWSDEKALTHI